VGSRKHSSASDFSNRPCINSCQNNILANVKAAIAVPAASWFVVASLAISLLLADSWRGQSTEITDTVLHTINWNVRSVMMRADFPPTCAPLRRAGPEPPRLALFRPLGKELTLAALSYLLCVLRTLGQSPVSGGNEQHLALSGRMRHFLSLSRASSARSSQYCASLFLDGTSSQTSATDTPKLTSQFDCER
jgi:hypothetical protein